MSRDRSRSRAVLIGTSYHHDPHLRPLPAATCVSAMVDLLTGEQCGWPRERVTALEDLDSPRDAIVELVPLVRDVADVLLVYYVGHGLRTRDGQLALALTGTVADPEILPDSSLVYPRLMEVLRGSPAATKLVILDCCHAELGLDAEYHFQSGPGDLASAYPIDGMYFIGASTRYEKARSPLGGRLTHFTHRLIDVVTTGIPGKPAELTLQQIFVETRARLLRDKLPQPVDGGMRDAYRLPFARNAAYSGPSDGSDPAEPWPPARPRPLPRPRRPGRRAVLLTAAGLAVGAGAAAVPLVRTLAAADGGTASRAAFTPVPYATLDQRHVMATEFSPDGKVLAAGTADGTITLWDVASRERLATLTDYTAPSGLGVTALAFSSDGTTLAAVDRPDREGDTRFDGTVSLWEVPTRRRLATLTDRGVIVTNAIAFSPKGAILATANGNGTVSLWSAAARSRIGTLTGAVAGAPTVSKDVSSVAFSPDGTILALSTRAGLVELWDATTFARRATLAGPGTGVGALSFSPDGGTLAGVIGNHAVQLWDTATHQDLATLRYTDTVDDVVSGIVYSLVHTPDGRFLVGGTGEGLIVVWDTATRAVATTLGRFTDADSGISSGVSLAVSADGATLAAALLREIRLWKLR